MPLCAADLEVIVRRAAPADGGWARSLVALVEAAEAEPAALLAGAQAGDGAELPFEHVLRPFVDHALRGLAQVVPATDLLTPAALADLARQLLARLCRLWTPTLELEFTIARAADRSVAGGAPSLAALAGDARGRYRRFVHRLLHAGLARFFREYSVLARRTVAAIDLWTEATGELLVRLSRDGARVQRELVPAAEGRVTRIQTQLSDPHDGGREVLALTFEGGGRVIYKPHELAADVAFASLARWLGARLQLQLVTPRALNLGTHGWVEHVVPEPCPDDAAVARFYWRAGAQLALFHVLGTVDCHFENVIANGEHPILCDHETLMHPRLGATLRNAALAGVPVSVAPGRTVLDVGFLPVWTGAAGTPPVDISGLAGGFGEETEYLDLACDHVNTDLMVSRPRRVRLDAAGNRPRVAGRPAELAAHLDALVAGFRAAAAVLVAARDDLVAESGPVAALARAGGRFVLRYSAYYAHLLRRMQEPELLREGQDVVAALERLAPRGSASAAVAELVQKEREALERLDVPRFAVARVPAELLDASPFAAFRETLAALDAEGIEQQANLIRAAILSAGATPVCAARAAPSPPAPDDPRAEARAIAAAFATHAIAGRDGSRTWIALNLGADGPRLALRPIGIGLYEGTAGVALFLAAMARFGEVGDAAELAEGAMRSTLRGLAGVTADGGKLPLHGQPLGLGGVLYALTRCAAWLDRPAWLEAAVAAVRRLPPQAIAGDPHCDVIDGVAGLIPGLLAVHRATGDAIALARAVDCGRHLLATQRAAKVGGRAWPTHGATMLAGFSHGAAGIACQLVRLAEVTGAGELLDAARDAVGYEQALFDEEAGNWPDLRGCSGDARAFAIGWCNGATGIALSRAAARAALPDVDGHVEAALGAMSRGGMGTFDGLCCGELGRIDGLASLAVTLRRPELLAAARSAAARALERRRARGGWHPVEHLPSGVFHPSLHLGAAGIGYALLRLAMPDRIPSVLWME